MIVVYPNSALYYITTQAHWGPLITIPLVNSLGISDVLFGKLSPSLTSHTLFHTIANSDTAVRVIAHFWAMGHHREKPNDTGKLCQLNRHRAKGGIWTHNCRVAGPQYYPKSHWGSSHSSHSIILLNYKPTNAVICFTTIWTKRYLSGDSIFYCQNML